MPPPEPQSSTLPPTGTYVFINRQIGLYWCADTSVAHESRPPHSSRRHPVAENCLICRVSSSTTIVTSVTSLAPPTIRDSTGNDVRVPVVDLGAVRLYYERAGDGPPLLLVNGSGTDLRREPNPFSFPVAKEFDLLAYDHRGLGRSEPIGPDRPPTMADFADDAIALLDHVGWARCRVLGISFGGMVAQEIALRAPTRVERLVLACTSAGGGGGASYPLHETWALQPEARIDQLIELMDTRARTDPEFAGLLRTWMESAEGGQGDAPEGLRRQLEARRRHDTWDRLADLDAPTLVAAGRYDGIAPLANAEALAARIRGARLAVFDGGHGFFAQDPAAWPVMISFLRD